jgi:predicted N-acetyltransferase YhbS
MNDALAFVLAEERPADANAIERLNERIFGPGRFARSAYRLREQRAGVAGLCFTAYVGTLLVGSNRMSLVRCGERDALLLGPLAVDPAFRSQGIGEALVQRSLAEARAAGYELVVLVGDESYYGRMGFRIVPPGRLQMPGPVDPRRLLYCELRAGALSGASGQLRPRL